MNRIYVESPMAWERPEIEEDVLKSAKEPSIELVIKKLLDLGLLKFEVVKNPFNREPYTATLYTALELDRFES